MPWSTFIANDGLAEIVPDSESSHGQDCVVVSQAPGGTMLSSRNVDIWIVRSPGKTGDIRERAAAGRGDAVVCRCWLGSGLAGG